ncbi:hypothetical protein BU15DRAFT_64631 [Melanogaster broomeanus]|nr:hypothetical protein BU15DRAFT_64631 [Melanogaster broomeanus]
MESAVLKKETAVLSEANMETMEVGEIEEHNKVRKPKKDALESYLAYGGQWMVILYDAVSEMCEVKYQYTGTRAYRKVSKMHNICMKGADTRSMKWWDCTWLKTKILQEEPMNTWQAVKILPSIKGHPARRQELLLQDYVWRLLESFNSTGLHYLTQQGDMKLTQFYSAMMLSYGGWTRDRWGAPLSIITLSRPIVSLSPSLHRHQPYSINIIDQPISMSQYEATMMVHTDEAFGKIKKLYEDYPPQANDAATMVIISWVVSILTLLEKSIRTTFLNFHKFNAEILTHINALEEADPNSSSEESGGESVEDSITGHRHTRPRQAEAPARGGTAARRRQRCSKCHACGHNTEACLTTDLASMKKRIAGNHKA